MIRPAPSPLLAAALLVLGIAGLLPVGWMLARLAAEPEALSVLGLGGAGADPRVMGLLGRTIGLGLASSGVAALLGAPFGFLVARTDLPGRGVLRAAGVLPFLIPPLLVAATWTQVVPLRGAPMTALLLGLSSAPVVALFTARAAERIDRRREEAALLTGGVRAALRLELPLLLPAVLAGAAFAFLFTIQDFALPDYVSSVGPKFNVFADEVFAVWSVDQDAAEAVATSVPLVLLTLAALLPGLLLMRRGALGTIERDFEAPRPLPLGRAKPLALLFALLFVLAGAGVPLGRLLWEAGGGPRGWTSEALRAAFARALELGREDLRDTILYATAAATLAVPLALALGHRAERGRFGRALIVLVVLPLAVPAILYGIGTVLVWNRPLLQAFYASGGLVVLMMIGRFLCFPTLVCQSATAAMDARLEEAALLAGAGPTRRLARIVAPPLRPSLFGAWTLVFVLAVRELDAAVIVPAAKHTAMYRVFNAVHFGRDDFVAALALLVIFVVVLPGLMWSLFSNRRMEFLP